MSQAGAWRSTGSGHPLTAVRGSVVGTALRYGRNGFRPDIGGKKPCPLVVRFRRGANVWSLAVAAQMGRAALEEALQPSFTVGSRVVACRVRVEPHAYVTVARL